MFAQQPEFTDRRDAGRRLAAALAHLAPAHPLVLALPRGGVPVAFEVARALDAELDLLIVRKLGAPGHAELGIGAVVDGADPHLVLNEEVVRQVNPPPRYVRDELHRQLAEIERRRHAYLGDAAPVSPEGRTVIVVDDGIATGGTIRAALDGVRKSRPKWLVLAVPVAPSMTLAALRSACDEIVCLAEPEPFFAVGAHYRTFDQTSDDEVVRLLHDARVLRPAGAAGIR
jgi:putative phosphoribosyl transferase